MRTELTNAMYAGRGEGWVGIPLNREEATLLGLDPWKPWSILLLTDAAVEKVNQNRSKYTTRVEYEAPPPGYQIRGKHLLYINDELISYVFEDEDSQAELDRLVLVRILNAD